MLNNFKQITPFKKIFFKRHFYSFMKLFLQLDFKKTAATRANPCTSLTPHGNEFAVKRMSNSGNNAHQQLLPARGSAAVTRGAYWAQICLDTLLTVSSSKAIIFCCNKMEYRNEKYLFAHSSLR